ncbi:MAG: 4-alpha-glucanotransferase [Ignavibacteriae bacterium]|nr:4-alpha-glucanotransferase [Ignavibacteriota bacterium]
MILSRRSSGILLHISSLPSVFGIGDFGSGAYHFADVLAKSGQKAWQILPLTPTDEASGNSPYSSSSLMAGNTLFISPEILQKDELLTRQNLRDNPEFRDNNVDFKEVYSFKKYLFDIAFDNFQSKTENAKDYEQFCFDNALWLDDYALYVALKKHFKGVGWWEWSEPLLKREKTALSIATAAHTQTIEQEKFLQFQFFKQWNALKKYCNSKHIAIIGDAPIYCSHDSADVWSNTPLFNLDSNGKPITVAGVPPDYFSTQGQRWGNPIYKWDEMKKNGYEWWINRMQHNFTLYDLVRIDHFRGLVAYWEIPSKEKTAINGQWKTAPAEDFLTALTSYFTHFPVIAEDLGMITEDVKQIMNRFSLPGMKVLQFAFGDSPDNPYLPHNYTHNSVVYSGTHDNNTTVGWYKNEVDGNVKSAIQKYIGAKSNSKSLHNDFIRLAHSSVAGLSITPLQDVLGLGAESRMNTPSTRKGNWEWRVEKSYLNSRNFNVLKHLTEIYGRS